MPAGAAEASPASSSGSERVSGASIPEIIALQPEVLTNSARVYDLVAAEDGVWAATSGGLVRWKADGTNKIFTIADGLPFNHLRAILSGGESLIWLASNDATTRVEIAGDDAHAFEGYTAEDGVEFGESPVLMADNDGSIWVASLYRDEPILRFDGSLWRPPKLPSDAPALAGISPQVSALLRAKDGALWVGLFEDGILRLAGDSWTRYSEKHGIPRQQVWRMLEDSDGRMWAATGGGGLRRFSPSDGLWERVEFQREEAPVVWISQLGDESLWVSGDNFIARSDDGGERWQLVATPGDGLSFPRAAVEDEEGRVWVATDRGVALYEGGQWRTLTRQGEVLSYSLARLYTAPDGKLWMLPQYGGKPSVMDIETGKSSPPEEWPSETPDVVSLAFEGDAVWAGLNVGLSSCGWSRGGSMGRH